MANILWKDQRAYRIAVTVTPDDTSVAAQKRLFKGYEESVEGAVNRRRVALMPLASLRPWMNALANEALAIIDKHHV